MGVLDRVRRRARRVATGTATAGRDIVKAPSRLIRSMRSSDGRDDPALKSKPAVASAEVLPGDGILGRARANPWLTVAIAAGSLLAAGWIAWAVYVTSENGATAGLGVVIAWPALLSLVALPIASLALLVRRLGSDGEPHSTPATAVEQAEEAEDGDAEDEADGEEARDSDDDQDAKEPEGSKAEEVPSG